MADCPGRRSDIDTFTARRSIMSVGAVSPVTSVSYRPTETRAQEAMETRAVTVQEAAHGDQEAMRKLANEKSANLEFANEKRDAEAAARKSPSPPGVGAFVDVLA
jgi:hypothetical protein